jgi:hypothetical protein
MFRFKGNHHHGTKSQYLAKITHLVQCGYVEVVQKLSVLWLHSMTCGAVPHRPYYAPKTLTTSVRPPCIHIEPSV